MNLIELEKSSLADLRQQGKELNIPRANRLKKEALLVGIRQAEAEKEGLEIRGGVLEIMNEGVGFLRSNHYQGGPEDVYVSQTQIRRYGLRSGDLVIGNVRPPRDSEKHYGLLKVESVNWVDAEEAKNRPRFETLVPIFPEERFDLDTNKRELATRMINLIAPIGRGQRGLIVSPPKSGKTTILKQIANAISTKYDDVHLMVALIGERPEEVTDISRHMEKVTAGMGEVAASNFDEPPEAQTRVGELALERAKRLVEIGYDVIIVLDSITRMARAYNLALPTSGRTLTGGFDPVALFPAKKFFGAARKIENGGSLTIVGTCLVETGSRMDDLIYEEFKGTGNMELHLVRKLADKRIFPAIDVTRSGTRQEELLFGEETLIKIHTLRRMLETIRDDSERTETLLESLRKTESNEEYLESLKIA